MPLEDHAAVWHRVEERLSVVESRVHAHAEPEIAGAFQREAEDQPDGEHSGGADPALPRIAQVHQAKGSGKNHRGGPKADPFGQGILRIASEEKLLEQSNNN